MRLTLLATLIVLLTLCSCTNDDAAIKSVVYKWNEAHNNNDIGEFRQLYGSQVLFYGKTIPGESCYRKKEAFLTPLFSQKIISPIVITHYSSGTIKADFTKRTVFKKKPFEYLCYLLLEKDGGRYVVTGESDLISDEKRGTRLAIGQPVMKPSTKALIIAGIVFIVLLLLFLWNRARNKRRESSALAEHEELYATIPQPGNVQQVPTPEPDAEKKIINKVREQVLAEMKAMIATTPTAQDKGTAFEKYVVERFDAGYFKLLEWRGDKFHKGKYAASSRLPDLGYALKTKTSYTRFAVECKWRKSFDNGKIKWATPEQLKNYKIYAHERREPVFVIIGVGGEPANPATVYIVPLDVIQMIYATEGWLSNYKRYKSEGFFLDAVNMQLS